jgi:hypothetical protein
MRPAVLTTFAFVIAACLDRPAARGSDPLPSGSTEMERLRSPDGKVDAVLYLTRTDPLSSDIQSLRLEPVGEKGEWHGIVARATHTEGKKLGLRWVSDTLLEVVYHRGHIYDFDNEWWTYRLSPNKDEVHFVELRLSKEP